jgi:hypothetical protein
MLPQALSIWKGQLEGNNDEQAQTKTKPEVLHPAALKDLADISLLFERIKIADGVDDLKVIKYDLDKLLARVKPIGSRPIDKTCPKCGQKL